MKTNTKNPYFASLIQWIIICAVIAGLLAIGIFVFGHPHLLDTPYVSPQESWCESHGGEIFYGAWGGETCQFAPK
jgi:hypothetical protein